MLFVISPLSPARIRWPVQLSSRAIRSLLYVFLALWQLVIISCLQTNLAKARGYCFESWALARETGSPFAAGFALLAFGLVACFGGQARQGVRLLVAVEAALGQRGGKLPEGEPSFMVARQALGKAQAQLGPEAFEAALQEGRALTLEQAIALATAYENADV